MAFEREFPPRFAPTPNFEPLVTMFLIEALRQLGGTMKVTYEAAYHAQDSAFTADRDPETLSWIVALVGHDHHQAASAMDAEVIPQATLPPPKEAGQ